MSSNEVAPPAADGSNDSAGASAATDAPGSDPTNASERQASLPPVSSADRVVLALDLTARSFVAGLVDVRGGLVHRSHVDLDALAGPEVLDSALSTLVENTMTVGRDQLGLQIMAVGAVLPGIVEPGLVSVSPRDMALWADYPLKERLEDLTGLGVFGDADAKGLALAEGWLGAAQGHANFCAITMSSGIGGGVVIDNELLEGRSGRAGGVGHIIVEPGGRRCYCGAQGCLDAEASGAAIETITGRSVVEPTYEIMQRTGAMVGRGASILCNSLDLTLVVVGGPVALGFAATFFHSAQVALDEAALLPYSRGARITPSRLGATGPLVGAGAFAWRGLRRSRRGKRPARSPADN